MWYYPENSDSTVDLNHWLLYEIMLHIMVLFDQIISYFEENQCLGVQDE